MTLKSLRIAVLGAAAAGLIGGLVVCPISSAQPGGLDAFIDCMTDNGLPAPPAGMGPPPGGMPQFDASDGQTPDAPPGVDQGTWDKAWKACSSLAPTSPQ